jgi:hypothetical protein
MAGLEQFHQRKSHDKADGTPFEASQSGLKHPAQTLAQPTTALKRTLDLGAALNQCTHQLGAHLQNQGFEGPSTVSAQEKILLTARETPRPQRPSSFSQLFSSYVASVSGRLGQLPPP